MSWMQSSRHSAAHLPSFIKAQPKAILTYSSFPFLLRLTACGRAGVEDGGHGEWGVFWNLEVETGGKAGWGGGRFLTKDRDMKPDWAHSA